MKISYGGSAVNIDIPARNLAEYVTPSQVDAGDDIHGVLEQAMEDADLRLRDCCAGKRVSLLIADSTRAQPHLAMAAACLRELGPAKAVNLVMATGSHTADTPENHAIANAIVAEAKTLGAPIDRVIFHDCEAADFDDFGQTPSGTPIRVNAAANDADMFVVNTDMKPHYFAGYSNGLKYFLPGISAFACVEANHAFALDPKATFGRHALHPHADRRDNPLSQDMLDYFHVATRGRPVFGLATIASKTEITWAAAGALLDVIPRGIAEVDRLMTRHVEPHKHIIVSCGGYPNDESLYIGQRALELTSNAYAPGAEVLFLCQCRNGIAPTAKAKKNFYDPLARPLPEVKTMIEDDYVLYAHKAYKFAVLLEKMNAVHMHSNLSDDVVEAIHMAPAQDPQSVVDGWLLDDPDARIVVFDKANKLAII